MAVVGGERKRAITASGIAWLCVVLVAGISPLVTANLTSTGLFRYPFLYDQHFLLRAVLVASLAFLGLTAAAFAAFAEERPWRFAAPLWALLAFLVLAALSGAVAGKPVNALVGDYLHYEGVLMLAAYASLTLTAMLTVTRDRLVVLARVIALSGALVAAYGVAQMLGFDPTDWLSAPNFSRSRAFSTWGNPDFLGGYLLFPMTFAALLACVESSRPWRIAGWTTFALCALALGGTQTRGAWIAGAVAIGLVAWVLVRAGSTRSAIAVGAGAALATVGVFVLAASQVIQRLSTVTSVADKGVGGRLTIWRIALKAAGANPLFGGGPDAFVATTRPFSQYLTFVPNDAHNYPLQLAVTLGIPAALALYGFFAWTLGSSAPKVLRAPRPDESLLVASAWIAAVAYVVHLMFGLSLAASTALLFVCLGVVLASLSQRTGQARAVSVAVMVAAASTATISIALGAAGISADSAMMKARIAAHENGPRLEWALKAARINPHFERYAQELSAAKMGGEQTLEPAADTP